MTAGSDLFITKHGNDLSNSILKEIDFSDIDTEIDQDTSEPQIVFPSQPIPSLTQPPVTSLVLNSPHTSTQPQIYIPPSSTLSTTLNQISQPTDIPDVTSLASARFSVDFGKELLPNVRATVQITPTHVCVLIKSLPSKDPQRAQQWIHSLKRALSQHLDQEIEIEYQEEETADE